VLGKTRKLKEREIQKTGSDRKSQDLTWEKAGSTRIHEELEGNERKGKEVEGFTGKLKEIVLFRALHLVLSNKCRETNGTVPFRPTVHGV
jgi:hypothetical protein